MKVRRVTGWWSKLQGFSWVEMVQKTWRWKRRRMVTMGSISRGEVRATDVFIPKWSIGSIFA